MRVYFEDTDLSGMVYHANYLRFMERARSDLLRLIGIDQRQAFEAGLGAYAVTEIAIRYRAPARLDDDLTVETRLLSARATTRLSQTIICGERTLVSADVGVAFVGPDGRVKRQSRDWTAKLALLSLPG